MDENEKESIEKMKQSLLIFIVRDIFEDEIRKIIIGGKYETIEELDKIIDPKLRDYLELKQQIKDFYDAKIYE